MSIPTRVWTVICCRWCEVWFAGLPTSQPLTNQVLNHPVAEEEGGLKLVFLLSVSAPPPRNPGDALPQSLLRASTSRRFH